MDVRNTFGNTALISAAINGDIEVVRILCENGAQLDIEDNNGNTALKIASRRDHYDIVRILCENGADVRNWDRKDDFLKQACINGHNKFVRGLLQGGANQNSAGCVQISLELYYQEIFLMLIKAGAEVNQVSKDKYLLV